MSSTAHGFAGVDWRLTHQAKCGILDVMSLSWRHDQQGMFMLANPTPCYVRLASTPWRREVDECAERQQIVREATGWRSFLWMGDVVTAIMNLGPYRLKVTLAPADDSAQ
jgi:hypothetical protein